MSELQFWVAFAFMLGVVAGVMVVALCNAAAEGDRCFHCDGLGHRCGDGCGYCGGTGRAGQGEAP